VADSIRYLAAPAGNPGNRQVRLKGIGAADLEALDPPDLQLPLALYPQCSAWEPTEAVDVISSDGDRFNAHVEDVTQRPEPLIWLVLD